MEQNSKAIKSFCIENINKKQTDTQHVDGETNKKEPDEEAEKILQRVLK